MERGDVTTSRGRRAHPPLPRAGYGAPADPRLPDGCYLISYRPRNDATVVYDGTLRIETKTGRVIASGDLYQRPVEIDAPEAGPDPAAGIPIFPIARYRYYLHVTRLVSDPSGLRLDIETYRFTPGGVDLLDGSHTKWPRESAARASLAASTAPAGFPSPGAYFTGDVMNDEGAVIGALTMGLVSSSLRKATIEIDRVPASELPLDNRAGVDWRMVFDEVGWDLTLAISDANIEEPSGESWSAAEAHAVMLARRDRNDLDAEWRYYVLAVRRIDPATSTTDPARGERGFMFDVNLHDVNRVPREGLMIASHWPIPSTPEWGAVQGQRSGATPLYFRTAVHELGHAMGLDHNFDDNGIMCTTEDLAARSVLPGSRPFPMNLGWSFAPEDAHRLRHWPDIVVRPGGDSLQLVINTAPIDPLASTRQRLDVRPVSGSVPIGAPVRLELRLVNTTDEKVTMPANLGQLAGNVRGVVVDPGGTRRSFAPVAVDEVAPAQVGPGQSVDGSLTLLHGHDGALFPGPGRYRVVVEAEWTIRGMPAFVRGEATLVVDPPADEIQAAAARTVLRTPETTPALVLGGDHLKDGLAAIAGAMRSAVLRPHFTFGAARRLATRFGTRAPDLVAAAQLIDTTTVMTSAELAEAKRIVDDSAGTPGVDALAAALDAWAAAHARP